MWLCHDKFKLLAMVRQIIDHRNLELSFSHQQRQNDMFNRQSPFPLSNAVSTYTIAPQRRRKELTKKTLSLLFVCLVGAGLALVV